MWPIDRPPHWVGRTPELATLRAGVEALRRGEGTVIWVEGEPGIGKSSLVAQALAEAADPGWDVGWGIAEQLAERLPLRVMLDCFQVRPDSPDPRRAHASDLIRKQRLGLFAGGDAAAGVEVLVTLADELCAAAPTVLVIDDLQWADDASLIVWYQLAAAIDQLRLLLVATCRQLPGALEDLAAVLASGGRPDEAKAALDEAVSLYEDLDARWDVRRADSRLRAYGIRRGGRGRREARPASGWEALTPTELKIAALVARGDSTSDIARGMFLSRRTVQSYISHILAKLGAKGRADIVREALRQGIMP